MTCSPPLTEVIRSRLQTLNPEYLAIHDDSAAHTGHIGAAQGGGHFEITIVSAAFLGKNRLARHRLVHAPLQDLIPQRIHAVAIKAFTPEEFC